MHLMKFQSEWAGSETKLDLKGIYARREDPLTLTSPLPLRRHLDWTRKGLVFVCLSSLDELGLVAASIREANDDPLEMRDCFDKRTGQFNTPAYLADVKRNLAQRAAELQEKVDRYGADAVLDMMRTSDPDFTFPAGVGERPTAAARQRTQDGETTPEKSEKPKPKKGSASAPKPRATKAASEDPDLVGGFTG